VDLKLCGDLGQILFLPFYLRDDESIYRAVKHSNVVINTIGQEISTPSFELEDVHVDGARRIARICREAGVQRFIHLSALNCHPNPKPVIKRKGSEFYRTKYYGELAVRQEFPSATIFRPSEIFGPADRYFHYYPHWWRRSYHRIVLWNRGRGIFKMPVYASDLTDGIVKAIFDDNAVGRTYDAVG
jgi:NADH dehydrogenase (ubiquinone) 1 alpha subcomplex subunit 9